jgi:hypothetical protein
MASRFRIRIEDTSTGREANLVPGGQGERDLIESCVAAIARRGVGVLRTEAQVQAAIREGIAETLYLLKSEVLP